MNIARYFADFFIDIARESRHTFQSRHDGHFVLQMLSFSIFRAEEEKYLIYNYQPFYYGSEERNGGFEQAYVF